MKFNIRSIAAATILLAGVTAYGVLADTPNDAALVEHGAYLVNNVGMCADCHSPRGERGELIPERNLQGSPIGFKPLAPMPWADAAPALAGLPSMTEAQAVKFLQTGIRPGGSIPRPPMPSFRFSEHDARAVVAYLKSLGK